MRTGTILLATLLLGQMACDPGPEQVWSEGNDLRETQEEGGEDFPAMQLILETRDPGLWQVSGEWAFTDIEGFERIAGGEFGESWLMHEVPEHSRVRFAARIEQHGHLRVLVRAREESGYDFVAEAGMIRLERRSNSEMQVVAATEPGLSVNQWSQMEIRQQGDRIMLLVEGSVALDFTDPEPLPSGAFGLAGSDLVLDVLEQAAGLYDVLSLEPRDPEAGGFSRIVDIGGKSTTLVYDWVADFAVLVNGTELAAKGIEVASADKLLNGGALSQDPKYLCRAPIIDRITPNQVPLYRGTDPNRGKIVVAGRFFLCEPQPSQEANIVVRFSNGEIQFTVPAVAEPMLDSHGAVVPDAYEADVDLTNYLTTLSSMYGSFEVVVVGHPYGSLSQPSKVYLLAPWPTEQMLVSTISGIKMADDGDDQSNRGEPEHRLSFTGGAMFWTPSASKFTPQSNLIEFPTLNHGVFEAKPGDPQEYALQIPLWSGASTWTSEAILHYHGGIEEDDSAFTDVMSAIGAVAGTVIGAYTSGSVEGAFKGTKTGYEVAKEIMGLLDDTDHESFGIHHNAYMECASATATPSIPGNSCPNPYGTGTYIGWQPFNNVADYSADGVDAQLKVKNYYEQAPMVDRVKVTLKSIKVTDSNEIDNDADVYVYARAAFNGNAYQGRRFKDGAELGTWEIDEGDTLAVNQVLTEWEVTTQNPVPLPLTWVYVEMSFWDEDTNHDDDMGIVTLMFRPHVLLPKGYTTYPHTVTGSTCGVPDAEPCLDYTLEIITSRSP